MGGDAVKMPACKFCGGPVEFGHSVFRICTRCMFRKEKAKVKLPGYFRTGGRAADGI